jgi:proteasome lid subunit RPN8/RPN11
MVTHPGPASVRLSRAIAEAIEVQARGESPLEACGLIAGSAPADEGGLALRYVPCRNSAASADRYTIHEDDMLRVTIETDDADEAIWGIVHSHVTLPAVPSRTDIRQATFPDALYLLISLAHEPALRAWRIVEGAIHEVALEVA